jgi:hypothetical protein
MPVSMTLTFLPNAVYFCFEMFVVSAVLLLSALVTLTFARLFNTMFVLLFLIIVSYFSLNCFLCCLTYHARTHPLTHPILTPTPISILSSTLSWQDEDDLSAYICTEDQVAQKCEAEKAERAHALKRRMQLNNASPTAAPRR